jgi:hypothetical protein
MTLAVCEVIPLTVLSVVRKSTTPMPSKQAGRADSRKVADAGLGKDIWAVPFHDITRILKIYYFDEDLYLTCLPMVKISILLFYLRIFPAKWFRNAVFVAIGCCAGYAIAFLLVSVFQCRPIDLAWWRWDGEHAGSCNDINVRKTMGRTLFAV